MLSLLVRRRHVEGPQDDYRILAGNETIQKPKQLLELARLLMTTQVVLEVGYQYPHKRRVGLHLASQHAPPWTAAPFLIIKRLGVQNRELGEDGNAVGAYSLRAHEIPSLEVSAGNKICGQR